MTTAAAGQVPTWLTALIAALAVVLGASATAVATVVSANRKVREVEISYLQRLQESYLDNARAYTNSVYVPLAVTLTRLSASFETFRVEIEAGDNDTDAMSTMGGAIDRFAEEIKVLQDRGAAALFTTALEEELERFISFVTNSRTAASTVRKAVVRIRFLGYEIAQEISTPWLIRQFRFMEQISLPVIIGPKTYVERNQVLAAALASRDFEAEFAVGLNALRQLIKEVTLGAQARR